MTREEDIKARYDKVKKGPWTFEKPDNSAIILGQSSDPIFYGTIAMFHICPACAERGGDCGAPDEAHREFIKHSVMDVPYLLARNEELHGELGWHKRELEEKVDEIYWLMDDKIDLQDDRAKLQRRVENMKMALVAIKEEAAAFASDERDLGYIFIGIYTLATNILDAKDQDDENHSN